MSRSLDSREISNKRKKEKFGFVLRDIIESQNENISFSQEIKEGDLDKDSFSFKKSFTMKVLDQIHQHKVIHSHESIVGSDKDKPIASNNNSSSLGTPRLN